ncbi:MAG: hypothetical protein AAB337_02790 [Patescibacteria group bacterium]
MAKEIFSQTLNIATHHTKPLTRFLQHIFKKRYAHRRFARVWFAIDLGLLIIALSLFGWVLGKTLFAPPTIEKQILISATVAPTDVVSGASSTLIFRYENRSNETLKHAQLELAFPKHFSLDAVESEQNEIAMQTYDLGEISGGTSGSLKIRGVMFGDVGGDQTFTTTLRFVYGDENTPVTKTETHNFKPMRSTLSLELILPERVVEGQTVSGEIRYKNTGEIDFPEIVIEPTWPEDFALLSSNPSPRDGLFALRALKAGEEGTIEFTGRLPSQASIHFSFTPSFTFGETFYRQEVLEQDVELLPSQLSVSAELEQTTFTPGADAVVLVRVQHVGEETVQNVRLIMKTSSTIFKTQTMELDLGELSPGGSSSATFEIPTVNSIASSSTNVYENLIASLDLYVSYTLPDDIDQDVSLYAGSISGKVTSPIVLETFARYTSPQGDQIGRGPLPPVVDETTKYWVFLTVDETTSTLTDVKLEANLGDGVTFTGKQSVSIGESISYDAESNAIIWIIDSLSPTLDPNANIASVAIEVALTPDDEMVGTTPTLISSPLVTGRDSWTGAFVTARGTTVTTDLPYDDMAAGNGVVE